MPKRLVVLFDGTWNTPEDGTNVSRFHKMIDQGQVDGYVQQCFYDPGVGTHWYDRVTGGAFGRGLSKNIMDGYAWLSDYYRDGDEVFIFGFSRGAYTARSLVGLIRKCGVLKAADRGLIEKAYELYRKKDSSPDSDEAKAFRENHSREIRVKFIGVWDTVGALGIPGSNLPFGKDYYQFHDTELSKIVDYAYHAVAVDEHRKDYAPTLWTKTKDENKEVEQRWFVGAHANVGGGYKNDALPRLPGKWLQEKARARGLVFREAIAVTANDHLHPVRDSFKEFLFGIYDWFKKRHHRPIGQTVRETIDESVWLRWDTNGSYRPPSLEGKR